MPGEVTPLVAAVNQALARLEAALGAQRRFVGDAAHTLRTPLAVLTARLDALPEGPETAALRRDADRMTRLIEQMLQMARLDGTPLDVTQPWICTPSQSRRSVQWHRSRCGTMCSSR